jgi:hypothetical protein
MASSLAKSDSTFEQQAPNLIKTDDQLDLQSLHRVRERWVTRRTAVINQRWYRPYWEGIPDWGCQYGSGSRKRSREDRWIAV